MTVRVPLNGSQGEVHHFPLYRTYVRYIGVGALSGMGSLDEISEMIIANNSLFRYNVRTEGHP